MTSLVLKIHAVVVHWFATRSSVSRYFTYLVTRL